MRKVSRRLGLTLTSVLSLTACTGSNAEELSIRQATGLTVAERRAIIDNKVPEWLTRYGVPSAAVTLISDGEIAWTAVFGDQAHETPATESTLYSTASLAKPMTAEVVLRLVSQGRLSLDEPMASHWIDPDLADDPRHTLLTPRIALTHQTGFPNWRLQTDSLLQFEWDPGTDTGYSGEGFTYVARFVERKLDRPFQEIAEEVLFEPTGMRNTSFVDQDWFNGRLASRLMADGTWHEPVTRSEASGAGRGVRTTSEDYARFVLSVMRNSGVSDGEAAERLQMSRDQVDLCYAKLDPASCPARMGFGLSWYVYEYDSHMLVAHRGSNLGEKTIALYAPDTGLGMTILTNGENGNHVIFEIVRVLYGNEDFIALEGPSDS